VSVKTCPFCFLPTLRYSATGKHGPFWRDTAACGTSLFLGDRAGPKTTAVASARLHALVGSMQTWFDGSALSASAARRRLLDEAKTSHGPALSGIEAQMGKCPGCSEETALVRLDRRGRLIARCGHCFLCVYVGRDLGLPGFLKAFPDLAPIVLRIKSPQLVAHDHQQGVPAQESPSVLPSEGGARG
jgi:hypothetical protein